MPAPAARIAGAVRVGVIAISTSAGQPARTPKWSTGPSAQTCGARSDSFCLQENRLPLVSECRTTRQVVRFES
jgi:hypothetical protein